MKNTWKDSNSFLLLQKYNKERKPIGTLLSEDPSRFDRFSKRACKLLLDFSRSGLDEAALQRLLELAEERRLQDRRNRLFAGERINFTEDRPVLHPLWRSRKFNSLLEEDEVQRLEESSARMAVIVDALRGGHLPGESNASVRHVVHIGIGGSLLGPRMLVEACTADGRVGSEKSTPQIHFLSSVDPGPRESLLASINPRETVVIIVSKSFTTSEVLTHARSVFEWQEGALEPQEAASRRVAVTSRADRTHEFGIPASQVLEMGEWTGGRYSLWSPVGITAAIAMGPDGFDRLLDGGESMDRHFREAPLENNLPVIAGLIDVWNRNLEGRPGWAIIPYESRLALLSDWLQQAAMESNGKGADINGNPVTFETAPLVFGDTGTDAQHSFFQSFHQGPGDVAVDFVGVVNPGNNDRESDARLMSHLLAQATALARGRSLTEVQAEMRKEGCSEEGIARLAQHRVMPGDRPSNIILMEDFEPETLGALLVFYEHRVFVQSIIWGINAFDQWGVELGKKLAGVIEPAVADSTASPPATLVELGGILDYVHKLRR